MLTNNLGYIFECREDAHNKVGVMESHTRLYKDDELRITVVTAVDSNGKIVIPSLLNKSLGFMPLKSECKNEEEVIKFSKSNKPYFAVLGEFSLLVAGTLILDKDATMIKSTAGIYFYAPKTVSETIPEVVDNKGNQQPALICDRMSVDKGLNCLCVSEAVYKSYLANFIRGLDLSILEDRGKFLCSIVL